MEEPNDRETMNQLLRLNNALKATIKDFCSIETTPNHNIIRVLNCLKKFHETKQK